MTITLEGLAAVRSGLFNPEDVGAEAKKKLLFESIVGILKGFKSDPSDEFVRLILSRSEMTAKMRLAQRVIDTHREIVRAAMEAFVAQEALARFGYAPKDVVKTSGDRADVGGSATMPAIAAPEPEVETNAPSDDEIKFVTRLKNRLYFLIEDDRFFSEVEKIHFKKTRASFRVFYERPNNGSLVDLRFQKDGSMMLSVPVLDGELVSVEPSPKFDAVILKAFLQRLSEAGVGNDRAPKLRSIKGGHPEA